MTPLERARAFRARGLSLFPIPHGSKTPVIAWKAYQERHPTDAELEAWFDGLSLVNMGLVTGAISGLVVIDADTAAAVAYCIGWLPYTPWQTRTSRGGHFFLRHPGQPVANRGTDLVTAGGPLPVHVRGDHGYVLAPGSTHPSGAPYLACGDWQSPRRTIPIYSPDWITPTEAARTKSAPARPPALSNEDFLRRRAARYLAAVPVPQIGAGSDYATLKAACRLVRGFGLPAFDAVELLWQWCGNRDGWTREWVETKVLNAEKYGSETIGGLR